MKKEYKYMDLEGRIKLAKRLLLDYIDKVIDKHQYYPAAQEELKSELPHSKKLLEGVYDPDKMRILIGFEDSCNKGYNQLRIILHEQIEAIINCKELLDGKDLSTNDTKINHNKIDTICEKIVKEYKKSILPRHYIKNKPKKRRNR